MKKNSGDSTAKRCNGFHLVALAPGKRRFKRLKTISVGQTPMKDDDDRKVGEKEGDHIVDKLCVEKSRDFLPVESPNVGENHDSTHTTQISPVQSNPPASRTRGSFRRLDSKSQASPILEKSQDVGEHINVSEPIMKQLPKKGRGPTKLKINVGENHDSTHTTQRSPLQSNPPASRTRASFRRLDSKSRASPILEKSQDVGKNINVSEPTMKQIPKKGRGPTKLKIMTIEKHNKIDITFNEYGQPIGEASIGLASFLGSLVREVVPLTLQDWRKLSTSLKEVLWTSIQSRYNMKEDWQRNCLFQKMGRLWRAGKSRIVSQVQNASNDDELVKLKPTNIQSMQDWMDFVIEKKSARFKEKSEKFKSIKKRQLPHTCSRKGYARLAEEMKESCSDSSSEARVALWAKTHMKKDRDPINSQIAKILLEMKKKPGDTTAKRCIGFDLDAPRKRRSKRLKTFSVGLTTMEDDDDDDRTISDKEGDHIANELCVDQSSESPDYVPDESPNGGENHDSTHTTQRSPLTSNPPASCTRGAFRRLDSSGQATPILERSQDVGENINASEPIMKQPPNKCRDPTKIAIEEHNKMDITFNEYGQPIGEASIGMSSFLGALVREVVPVTLQDWRKLSTISKEILWTTIQSRYNMKEDWQKKYIFRKMGRLWNAGKSRIVSQFQNATAEELVKLKPTNVQFMHDWMDFVEEKKSAKFKARSEKFKSLKKRQLPHTCSRKGYARLAEEMKKSCSDLTSVTRVALWAKAHIKKDGNPVNSRVAKTLERIEQIDNEGTNTTSTNVTNDALSKILGPDRSHIRGLGFGVTFSKLSVVPPTKAINYAKLEEKYKKIEGEMSEMRDLMSYLLKSQGNTSEQLSNATNEPIVNNVATDQVVSSPLSINNVNTIYECKLLDWCGKGEVVAKGRWSSNDPKVMVHHVPLGPHAVRVWVDLPMKPDAFLWRPNLEMTYIKDAVGSTIAWPSDKITMVDERISIDHLGHQHD